MSVDAGMGGGAKGGYGIGSQFCDFSFGMASLINKTESLLSLCGNLKMPIKSISPLSSAIYTAPARLCVEPNLWHFQSASASIVSDIELGVTGEHWPEHSQRVGQCKHIG